ncbi:MAG: sulfite oxidase-like oxidoreductase [Conexivisphaerales archaeon]|jgi:DMSO/TMAO reductase YedYZ molybdopterin-dependent catalytic subunit
MSKPAEASSSTPPNQKYIKQFIFYGALGVPEVDISSYRLRVKGLVERPLELTYDQLKARPQVTVAKPSHCVTGWSVADTVWRGPSLPALLKEAGMKPEAHFIMFRSLDGYGTPIPLEDGMVEDAIVAIMLNGQPISLEMGFPARPFMPHIYLWKSAKWLTEIEALAEYVDGYWETRGYNERGNIWEEERFKSWGKHERHSVIRRAMGL